MDFVAFPDLKISEASFLDAITERSCCIKCKKSRMYFCYDCYIPVKSLEGKLPCVEVGVDLWLFI